SASAYVRDEIDITRWLHATVGARFVDGLYQDPQKSTPDFAFDRWNPFGGVAVRLSPAMVVLAAAFRNTNGDFISSKISPPTVAGFVLERNELPTTVRDEGGVAVQNTWSRSFLEVRGILRRSRTPAFQIFSPDLAPFAQLLTPPDADFKARGFSMFFNQIVTREISVFADEQFATRKAFLFERDDNQVRVGANYIHPIGLSARISTRFLSQHFRNNQVVGLQDSDFALTD